MLFRSLAATSVVRSGRLFSVAVPDHFTAVFVTGEDSCHDEEQIRKSVEVTRRLWADGAVCGERPHTALRPADRGTREVTSRGGRTSPRQNEILEGRQRLVERVERRFESVGVRGLNERHARDAELAPEIEKIVLNLDEAVHDGLRKARDGEDQADGAIGLGDRAIGLNPGVVFGDAAAVTESGGAVVPGAGVDLAQAVSHDV